jgi:hypothetical protein
MGKKSLRNRAAKQSSSKQSDSSKDESYESIIESIARHLVTFSSPQNESCGQLLIRLTRFWVQDTSKRRELAWTVNSLCSGYGQHDGMSTQFDFMYRFMNKMLDHINAGEFELARLWRLSLYVLVRERASGRTKSEWLRSLKGLIDEIKMNDKELQFNTAKYLSQSRVMSPIESCYYYSKSVCRMTQWAILVRFAIGKQGHYICGHHVNINVVYLTENGLITELTIWVNETIKLKTLLWRLQDELKIDLGNHENVTLQDEGGLAKGSLIMKYSGNKTLEHIGFENNDVLQIVNASAMDIASKPISRMQKKKEKQSSSVVSTKENTSKSLSRRTVKPRISGSKKQSHQNQTSYCSDIDQDRVKHSKFLTLVFEEATELFQTRRQRLNKLSLKKCKPKQKNAILKPKTSASEPGSHCCLPDTGRKAGKTVFPVLVGHQDYLYKSSKYTRHLQSTPYTIDLHGCTKEDAVNKLDSSLPFWIDEATKELPGTVGVNIIAGGGNQIVAEAVEHWICEKRNVGKRFT